MLRPRLVSGRSVCATTASPTVAGPSIIILAHRSLTLIRTATIDGVSSHVETRQVRNDYTLRLDSVAQDRGGRLRAK